MTMLPLSMAVHAAEDGTGLNPRATARSAGSRERNALEYEENDRPSLYFDMGKDILKSDRARR